MFMVFSWSVSLLNAPKRKCGYTGPEGWHCLGDFMVVPLLLSVHKAPCPLRNFSDNLHQAYWSMVEESAFFLFL